MAGEAIFIGYRRDDTADVAGRIYDAMAKRFGKARIFKDVDNIGPGVVFGDYIKTVLPRCRVALVLIGPHWLESKDESGKRRLDDDQDWVRIEIETALATPQLLVVPVLVNGARMPRADDVPNGLHPLLGRNAAIIRRDPDFHDDADRLATALRDSVTTGKLDLSNIGGKATGAGPSQRRGAGGRTLLLIAGAVMAALTVSWVVTSGQRGGAQKAGEQSPAAASESERAAINNGPGVITLSLRPFGIVAAVRDPDGWGPADAVLPEYQWTRDGSLIAGQLGNTLLSDFVEPGHEYKVRVRYRDGHGNIESAESTPIRP